MTPYEILNEECKYLNLLFTNTDADKVLTLCLCAKIHFALKCNLISENDHNLLINKARLLMYAED